MLKPQQNSTRPTDTCACGQPKKKIAKYCLHCGRDINKIRSSIKGSSSKEVRERLEVRLKEMLIFHWTYEEPIKTKTDKMNEKRAREKED